MGDRAPRHPTGPAAGAAAAGRASQRTARRAAEQRRCRQVFRQAIRDARAAGAHAISMQNGALHLKVWLQQPTQPHKPPAEKQPSPSKQPDKPLSARQVKRQARGVERARKHNISLQYKKLASCKLRLCLQKAMRAIRFQRMWAVARPVMEGQIARRTVEHLVQRVPPAAGEMAAAPGMASTQRAKTPPRAAKRTADERSPDKGIAVAMGSPSSSDIAPETSARAQRITYALAALQHIRGPSARERALNPPVRQRRADAW